MTTSIIGVSFHLLDHAKILVALCHLHTRITHTSAPTFQTLPTYLCQQKSQEHSLKVSSGCSLQTKLFQFNYNTSYLSMIDIYLHNKQCMSSTKCTEDIK